MGKGGGGNWGIGWVLDYKFYFYRWKIKRLQKNVREKENES